MMLHQSSATKPYTARRKEHKFLNGLHQKETAIDIKLEAYFRNHLICFGIFIFFGIPLFLLLGVALSTTIFVLLFYGIAALI